MTKYKVVKNRIIFHNGQVVEFDFPIVKTIELNEVVFILLEIIGTQYNENVFAININGLVLWQIEESKTINDVVGECPYTAIEIKNDKLSLFNFCGFRFIVQPETGKIIDELFTK